MNLKKSYKVGLCTAAAIAAGCGGGGGTFGAADKGQVFLIQGSAFPGGPYSEYSVNLSDASVATAISQQGSNCAEGDLCTLTGMVVYVQPLPTGYSNLFVIPAGSTTPIQKTLMTANHHNPRFSADGNWIVFSEDVLPINGQPASAIFKVPSSGGIAVETQLTQGQGLTMWPSVSANGQTVIFSMNTSASMTSRGNFQLYTVPLKGGGITPLTGDANDYTSPMYNEDGSKILCSMETPPTTSTLGLPPPYQSSIVELPVANMKKPKILAQPPTETTNLITGVSKWSTYGHPRYLANDRVVVFDSSNLSSNGNNVPSSIAIYEWLRKTGSAAPFGSAVAPFQQIQGDE